MFFSKQRFLVCFAILIVHSNSISTIEAVGVGPANQLQPEVEKPLSVDTTALPRSSDIVINSIDDGLLSSAKHQASERHHYEPQSEINNDASPGQSKPEPRNQQDDQQVLSQQDQLIVDQRPSGSAQQLVDQSFNGQQEFGSQRQQQDQLANGPAQAQLYTTTTVSSLGQTIKQTTSSPQVYIPPVSPQVQQNPTSWFQSNQPATTFQVSQQPLTTSSLQQSQQGQGQQAQQQVSAPTSGNQAVVTVQHPTSINSIIASSSGQDLTAVPTSSQPSGQMVTVNGQQMLLVSPSQATNGRRISISGWLKGISSMLANIFNRRGEHGGQMAGSTTSGHWLQLGPNAPHWLSQAQTAIHQQQQQLQQQAQMLTSATNNRLVTFLNPSSQVSPAVTNQQQQQVIQVPANFQLDPMQASSNSLSYVTVQAPNMQPTSQQAQVQPNQQQAVPYQTSSSQQTQTNQQQLGSNSRQAGPEQQARGTWVTNGSSSPTSLPQSTNMGSSGQVQSGSGPKSSTRQHVSSGGNLPLAHYSGNFAAIASSSLYS